MVYNTPNLVKFGDFYSDPGLLLCTISAAGERSCNSQQDLSKRAQNSLFLGVLKQGFPPDLQQLPHSTASSYYHPTTAAWTAFK